MINKIIGALQGATGLSALELLLLGVMVLAGLAAFVVLVMSIFTSDDTMPLPQKKMKEPRG